MKKIVFLNNSGIGCWGGVEKWILEMGKELDRRGHKVFIAARKKSPLFEKSQTENLNTKQIHKLSPISFLNIIRVTNFSKWLKEKDIDAIFFCSSPTFKFGTTAGKLAGIRHIVYQRGSATPIKNKFYNKLLLNWVTTFIAISKATGEKALKHMDHFPQEKVKLIYHGIKINRFSDVELSTDLRKEFDINKDKLILINIGRLNQEKGQEDLIRAVAKLSEKSKKFVVLIVGAGPEDQKLKKLVNKFNLEDKIIFTGFRTDIPSLLKQSDFMVHTARQEGFGLVVAEAMAAGIPVVATNCGSLPELVIPGENGYLAKPNTPIDIADKILKMINSNIDKLGERGEEIVQEKFSFKRMVDKTREIFFNDSKNINNIK